MKIIKFDPNLPTLQGDPKRQKKSARRERANRFRFRSSDGSDITPEVWLSMWAALYPRKYNSEHDCLIAIHGPLSAERIERIGRWKDSAETTSKWRPNVASVAYQIWMEAAIDPPECPNENQVADFLRDWSERKYINNYGSGEREMHFGLSRATTLAYFISEGRFPIFDSRVRKAMMRLLGIPVPNSVRWYVDSFRPLFREIVALAAAENGRTVDKALFSYGGQIGQFED